MTGTGSLLAVLLVAPMLVGLVGLVGVAQDEASLESELRAARVEYVEELEQLAGWCGTRKLYAERDANLELLLLFEPDHKRARKSLKHRRARDGSWTVPENRKPAENVQTGHLDESRALRSEVGEAFADRVYGVVGFYESLGPEGGATPEQKRAAYDQIVAAFPGHAGVRAFRREVRFEQRWVLAETARAKPRRAALKAIVREAYAAVPALVEVELNELERAMGLSLTALGTPRVRVLGTVSREELERAARTAHATFDVYAGVFDAPVPQLEGYTVYLLADESDRDAFIRGWPAWGPERVSEVSLWAGAGVPNDIHVARWDERAEQRLDGLMRHTLGLCMMLDTQVGPNVAWAWEGLGMYLSRLVLGTRLTWYGSGQSTATAESKSKDLLSRLLNADVNWMNEAYQMLKSSRAPKLGPLLARNIDGMGVHDVLLAYAFAAYLLEGNADAVPGILTAVGAGQQSSAEAVSAALEGDLDQTGDRLRRWLSERR